MQGFGGVQSLVITTGVEQPLELNVQRVRAGPIRIRRGRWSLLVQRCQVRLPDDIRPDKLISMPRGGADEETIMARIGGIESTLESIFDDAASRNESPLTAARRRVDAVLASGRRER